MITHEEKKKIGKTSRAAGKAFELRVRHQMEDRELVVCKWSNQIDIINNKIIPAKSIFNPFTKSSTQGSGFPDFVAFSKTTNTTGMVVIGVESKMSKYLDAKEKEMCDWLLLNNIFSKLFIAYKGTLSTGKKGIVYKNYSTNVEYDEIWEGILNDKQKSRFKKVG